MSHTATTTSRLLAILGILLGSINLAACSTPAPAPTVTVTAAAPTTTPSADDSCPYVGDDNCDGYYQDGEAGPCPDQYGPDCEEGTADDRSAVSPSTTVSASDKEDIYLGAARSQDDPVLAEATDAQLIALGREACQYLDDGNGATGSAFLLGQAHNLTAKGAVFLTAAAHAIYCPDSPGYE